MGNGGWNRPSANQPTAQKKNGLSPVVKGLLGGGIVVVALGAVFYFLFSGDDIPEKAKSDRGPSMIKEATPAPAPKSAATNAAAVVQQPKKEEPKPYVKKPGQMPLPDGKILTFPPPKEGEIRKVYAYGHLYECDHLGNFKDVSKRQLFHTAFEANFLGLAQEGKPYIPAFLTGLDESAVKKMLEKNYVPIGDETDEEWASLKAYDDMRCAALAYMEQGGKFDDFVNEYATFDRKQRMAKSVSLKEVMTLYKQGKVAEAKDMAQAANTMMEQNGYRPINFPKHVQAAFDALPEQK